MRVPCRGARFRETGLRPGTGKRMPRRGGFSAAPLNQLIILPDTDFACSRDFVADELMIDRVPPLRFESTNRHSRICRSFPNGKANARGDGNSLTEE